MSAAAQVFHVSRGGVQPADVQPPDCRRRTRTVREAAAVLGVGRTTLAEAIARGEVRALRIGRRVVVPETELERLLAGAE